MVVRSKKQIVNRSGLLEKDLNRIVVSYMPMAQHEAVRYWSVLRKRKNPHYDIREGDTQKRNTDSLWLDDLQSAANMGLVIAKYKWDPYLTTCKHKCRLDGNGLIYAEKLRIAIHGGTCEHGESNYTFGAYAWSFVMGGIYAAFRKSHRKSPHPYPEDLLPGHSRDAKVSIRNGADPSLDYDYFYICIPSPVPLVDGSDYDGQPNACWPHADMTRLHQMIVSWIESGTWSYPGFEKSMLMNLISDLTVGLSVHEIAGMHNKKSSHVQEAVDQLRALMQKTPYAECGAVDKIWSLPDLAAVITTCYPEHPCKAKRLGEWLTRGWVPGIKTPEGRWMISNWGAKVAIRKWGDLHGIAEEDQNNNLDIPVPVPHKVISTMKQGKLIVLNHKGTALPEYENKVVVLEYIEVGRGKAKSCGVSNQGDRFYGKNLQEVLNRFKLVRCPHNIVKPRPE